jgi:hypothetical protein
MLSDLGRLCAALFLGLAACAPVGSGSGTLGELGGIDAIGGDATGGEVGGDADATEIGGVDADAAEIGGVDADAAEIGGVDADAAEIGGVDADAAEIGGADADAAEIGGADADATEIGGVDADAAEIGGVDADAAVSEVEVVPGDADASGPDLVDPPGCKDGANNQGESDVDCGGPHCSPCATGKYCETGTDCLSATCIFGVCEKPTCDDEQLNQSETDVDCGGTKCPACEDGRLCVDAQDCVSGNCAGGICISCADKAPNGTETDVDCGGDCAPCQVGKMCLGGGDCGTGLCAEGVCCVPNACGGCGALAADLCDGQDVDCDGQTDEDSATESPAPCGLTLGVCAGAEPECAGVEGWVCDAATYTAYDAAYESQETLCDDLDNDCDGQTDEALTAPKCAQQKGVCAGATSECVGAGGWVCDALVYGDHSADYEASEQTCDGLDNDCDGQTDEGLLNACGACGPAPTEACDGVDNDCDGTTDAPADMAPAPLCAKQAGVCAGAKATCGGAAGWVCTEAVFAANDPRWEGAELRCDSLDNDCDGSTDERAECAVCGGTPVVVADSKSFYAFPHAAQLWQGTVLIATGHPQTGSNAKTARYHKVGDSGVSSYSIPLATLEFTDGPTVAANSSFAHLFAGLGDETHYARYNGSGVYSKKGFTVADYVNGDSYLPIVAGSTYHIGLLHRDADANLAYVNFDAATWDVLATTGGNLNRASLALDRDGRAYALLRSSAGLRLWDIMPPTGGPKLQSVAGVGIDPIRIQVAQNVAGLDEVHVVYDDNDTYYYRSRIDGTWSTPYKIVTTLYASNMNLTLDPEDRPVITESDGASDTIYIHRLINGAWKKTTMLASSADILKPTVFVDGFGRHQLVYWANGISGGVMHHVVCKDSVGKPAACAPSCGGKACGDDGCGGSCGGCGLDASCVAGACVDLPQCGANPALTCSGRCGEYDPAETCQCDDLCSGEGDCCLDLDSCCGF